MKVEMDFGGLVLLVGIMALMACFTSVIVVMYGLTEWWQFVSVGFVVSANYCVAVTLVNKLLIWVSDAVGGVE